MTYYEMTLTTLVVFYILGRIIARRVRPTCRNRK